MKRLLAMIQPKNKKCVECGRDDLPHFSKRRCIYCASKSYSKPKKVTKKTSTKRKERGKERDEYFNYHIERCTHSEESGKPIYNPTRVHICHLIDKGRHPSLQGHLDNYVYLTIQEHTTLDTHLFRNEFEILEKKFPNSWKIICKRVKSIIHLCQENTKYIRKFKDYLEK